MAAMAISLVRAACQTSLKFVAPSLGKRSQGAETWHSRRHDPEPFSPCQGILRPGQRRTWCSYDHAGHLHLHHLAISESSIEVPLRVTTSPVSAISPSGSSLSCTLVIMDDELSALVALLAGFPALLGLFGVLVRRFDTITCVHSIILTKVVKVSIIDEDRVHLKHRRGQPPLLPLRRLPPPAPLQRWRALRLRPEVHIAITPRRCKPRAPGQEVPPMSKSAPLSLPRDDLRDMLILPRRPAMQRQRLVHGRTGSKLVDGRVLPKRPACSCKLHRVRRSGLASRRSLDLQALARRWGVLFGWPTDPSLRLSWIVQKGISIGALDV